MRTNEEKQQNEKKGSFNRMIEINFILFSTLFVTYFVFHSFS